MLERKTKVGRPKELKGVAKPTMLYLDETRLSDFRNLCENEYHISTSEGLRQLIEQELEKNELGEINPLNLKSRIENKKVTTWRQLLLTDLKDFTVKECQDKIRDIQDQEQLTKLNFMGRTITQMTSYRIKK